MRSRDGNSYRSLAICSVILFYSLALNAGEFLISYRYVVKDAVLYNESLQISHTMMPCAGTPYKTLFLSNINDESLNQIIEKNFEKFIDFIHKLGMHVQASQTTTNMQARSTTIMTLPTTCFQVDFNDSFVRISPLK